MSTVAEQSAGRAGEQPAGRSIPTDPAALLHTAEAAYLLGLSPRTLELLRVRGGGPLFIQVTARSVRYRRRDIDAHAAASKRRSTSDPGPRAGARP